MITRIAAGERYKADHGWLTSFHLFSFAEYYDENNLNFGTLRVLNDDYIDGKSGFGKHGHRDMEIVTIILEGVLTHEDSMGNRATIQAGEVQYMSAGAGVMHSEINEGEERVHLYQLWFLPRRRGLIPTYEERNISSLTPNMLVPVVSGYSISGAIAIQSEATVYLATLSEGCAVEHLVEPGKGVFVYITQGEIDINGILFASGDQARIVDETKLIFTAKEDARCIVVEVAL